MNFILFNLIKVKHFGLKVAPKHFKIKLNKLNSIDNRRNNKVRYKIHKQMIPNNHSENLI